MLKDPVEWTVVTISDPYQNSHLTHCKYKNNNECSPKCTFNVEALITSLYDEFSEINYMKKSLKVYISSCISSTPTKNNQPLQFALTVLLY